MSAVSAEETEKDGHRSGEQPTAQNSSQETKQRKQKRPERPLYRPPPANRSGRSGGGDGSSPDQREGTVDKSVSSERLLPEKTIPEPDRKPTEFEQQLPPDRHRKFRRDSKPYGIEKSNSDVGQNENFFGTSRGGRRDNGGRLERGEVTQSFRRRNDNGANGSEKNERTSFAKVRGGKSGNRHHDQQQYGPDTNRQKYPDRRSGIHDNHYSSDRASGRFERKQHQSVGQQNHGSQELISSTLSPADGSSRRVHGRGGRVKIEKGVQMEFTRTGIPIVRDKAEWMKIAKRMTGVPDAPENGNSCSPAMYNPSVPPPGYSNAGPEAPCASSSPLHVPDFSDQAEPIPKKELLPTAIAALDADHRTNLSWGDEMIEEDKKRAAAASASAVPIAVASSLNPEMGDKCQAQRGGIIPITAEMAHDMNRNQKWNQKGRGRNQQDAPRRQGPYTHARGGARKGSDTFPESRQLGCDDSGPSIRFSAPTLRTVCAPPDSYGHGRPISDASTYADRQDEYGYLPSYAVQQIANLDSEIMQLGSVVSTGRFRSTDVDLLLVCSENLRKTFADVVFNNPTNGEHQRTLEHRMWKCAFYHPVEALRAAMQSAPQPGPATYCRNALLKLIEEGIAFYEHLVTEHEDNFGFRLAEYLYQMDDKLITALPRPPSNVLVVVKYSLTSCQRYLLALGDLARYREQVKGTQQYGVARSYYNKAAQLAPTNGRAHNQLALLAVYTNRWLDAVFYYARSLAAKHAFVTAKESLNGLFDDIRRKVEYYEANWKQDVEQLKKERGAKRNNPPGKRLNQLEIWKFPNGAVSDVIEKQEIDDMAVLIKASAQELHKRSIAYLLHCAGILFTKIGRDRFSEVAELAMVQLRALLALEESPLTSAQLMQMTVILLYLVHHTSEGGGGETERGVIKETQNNAILLAFSVFGLLLERLELLLNSKNVIDAAKSPLHLLLPAIRIFSIWMTAENAYKMCSAVSSSIGGLDTERFSVSLWNNLAKVCTIVEDFKSWGAIKVVEPQDQKGKVPSGAFEAVLPEDVYTAAFFDIFPSKPTVTLLSQIVPPELAAEYCRLDWLLKLASVLHGYNCEWFTIEDGKFMARSGRCESPGAGRLRIVASDDEDYETVEVRRTRSSASDQEGTGDVGVLERMKKDSELKQSALEREGQYRTEIIIEPHQLVVDTNTFIDHRKLVEKIVLAKHYKLAVPFVVYNELSGLEKNDDAWVSQQAKASIKMLQEFTKGSLSAYSKYVEAVMTTGTILSDFDFARNEETASISNDDLILKCCINLLAATEPDYGARQEIKNLRCEPITKHQKVVLLTDDKNLGLKAKGDEIPAIGIKKFVTLAKLGLQ